MEERQETYKKRSKAFTTSNAAPVCCTQNPKIPGQIEGARVKSDFKGHNETRLHTTAKGIPEEACCRDGDEEIKRRSESQNLGLVNHPGPSKEVIVRSNIAD